MRATMRPAQAGLGSLLTVGAAGLTAGYAWAAGLPACAELAPHVAGWVYAGLALFAGGVLASVLLGARLMEEAQILRRIYVGFALAEAATALALAYYVAAQYSHYACG